MYSVVNANSTEQSNSILDKGTKSALFSTEIKTNTNQSSKSTESSLNVKESGSLNSIKEANDNLTSAQVTKDSYLDLLINSVNMIMSSGKVSIDYLNTIEIKEDSVIKSKVGEIISNQIESSFFSKKCENKSCAIIVDKPSDIIQAKILSQKSKSLWLCSKCYTAWKLGQYCYYCNIIYRDFSFNQQYYDNKTWIECDYCQKWTHLECEEKKGKLNNIKKLIKNEAFKYMCPFCVIEKEKRKKAEEDSQLLKKKRIGFHYDAFTDDNKNKKKNPNDFRRFLQCKNNNTNNININR